MNIKDVALNIAKFKDGDNLYPWQQVSNFLFEHWNFVKSIDCKCPKCNSPLISTIYEENHNIHDLIICTTCHSQFDTAFHQLRKDSTIDSDYIRGINPFIMALIRLLKSIGCESTFHENIGEYGVLYFPYEDATLGMWVDDTYAINIFYPNWAKISASDLTEEKIKAIQSYNLHHKNCIYWLVNNDSYTLSSNVFIDINLINENKLGYIKETLSDLVNTKPFFNSDNGEKVFLIPSNSIHSIINVLKNCGCSDINVDDENDIHFKWNEHSMYLNQLDKDTYQIVYHLVMLEDVTEDIVCPEDGVDMEALSLQWSNMIWPVKCTFYRPDARHNAITAKCPIHKHHFEEIHVKFICRRIKELVSFFDAHLFDLLYGTESGCEIIHTRYQPEIDNF